MRGNHSQRSRAGAVLFSLLLAGGCSTAGLTPGRPGPVEGQVITAEQIARTGARNAWDVLRTHAHLGFYESRTGEPVHLALRDSRTAPLVIVDGAPTEGLRWLHDTRASNIARIHVISGIEAVYRYGHFASGGAIHIVTKMGYR